MKEYQYEYEYTKNGKNVKVQCCTVYKVYENAEYELSCELSELERQGCTNVQGRVVELGAIK